MPYVRSKNGIKIYYETYGDGPCIVFIHANPLDHWMWLYQILQFSINFKVIAIDLRSYGRSDKSTEECSMRELSDDVLAVFERESIGKWVICGLSIGGSVATEFTLNHPDKTRGLVVVGSSGLGGRRINEVMDRRIDGFRTMGPRKYISQEISSLFSKGFVNSEVGSMIINLYIEKADKLKIKSIVQMYESLKWFDITDRVSKIKVPSLLIAGEFDGAREAVRSLHEVIDGSQFFVIPGAHHVCCLDSPKEFNGILSSFLNSLG